MDGDIFDSSSTLQERRRTPDKSNKTKAFKEAAPWNDACNA
jgi:hypothetical protein